MIASHILAGGAGFWLALAAVDLKGGKKMAALRCALGAVVSTLLACVVAA